MFDPKAVITQVQQGTHSSNWQVYRGTPNRGKVVIIVILSLVFGLATIAFQGIGLGIILIGAIVAFGVGSAEKKKGHSLLVILPEGVVYCPGGMLEETRWIIFAGMIDIKLASQTRTYTDVTTTPHHAYIDSTSRTRYWLDIFTIDGKYLQLAFEDFGYPASLCNSVIAAFKGYIYQTTGHI